MSLFLLFLRSASTFSDSLDLSADEDEEAQEAERLRRLLLLLLACSLLRLLPPKLSLAACCCRNVLNCTSEDGVDGAEVA